MTFNVPKRTALFSFALVGAVATASGVAAAQTDDQASTSSSATTGAPAKKHATKKSTKKANDASGTATTNPDVKDATTKANGAVPKANAAADAAGTTANGAVVGTDTERQNQRDAVAPRPNPQKTPPQKVGQTTTTAADVVHDVTQQTDRPGRYRPFALELNPLGLFVGGRVSINAEWAPVTHHVITLSPHFVHTSADVAASPSTTESETFTGFGGELGYRYYTGHRGMNGVFIGPSLIAGAYNAGLPNGDQPFTDVGVAADVGVQEIFADHIVVGGGVGVEYLSVSHDFHDLPAGPSTVASSGLKPRLLLEAGYGF